MNSLRRAPLGELPAETGRVRYAFSKPGLTGTTLFSWIDHGATFRLDLQSKPVSETVLGRGRELFMQETGPRSTASRRGPAVAQRTPVKPTDVWLNAAEMPYVLPGSGAGEVVGTGTVLGKPCEIRKLHTMHIWYWQGLPLRMERPASAQMRKLSLVAVQLETNVAHVPGLFQFPANTQITDFPRPDPVFPWANVATAGLAAVLFFIVVCVCVVERAFAQRPSVSQAAG